MKRNFFVLSFSFALILTSMLVTSCDKDYASVESNVINNNNINLTTNSKTLPIAAYNKTLDSLEISGLSSNFLGVYNDPAFGTTTANIVAQITPSSYSPDFGEEPVIDSVVITIPYFSRISGKDNNGANVYKITDSILGTKPITLSIYRNTYFIRDFDPNADLGEDQKYYAKNNGEVLNGTSTINFDVFKSDLIHKTIAFVPSNKQIPLTAVDDKGKKTTTETLAPAYRQRLDHNFWKTTIIDKKGSTELSGATQFANYFRGLYFKAEAIDGTGNMSLLNLANANASIIMYYKNKKSKDNKFTFKFTGKKLNTFVTDYNKVVLANGNTTTGDEKLNIKGSNGSMAVVNLFNGNVNYNGETISAVEAFKRDFRISKNGAYEKDEYGNFKLKRLLNDAILTVYEDENLNTGGNADLHKYDRIFAYDLKNNTTLADYAVDPLANTNVPFNSKIFHLGQRFKPTGETRYKFKIHLTEHLNNILLKDSTNTKIGLVLSSNVNIVTMSNILKSKNVVTKVPTTAIITPRGTILYGTNTTDDKKMKLDIFYTEKK